MSDCEHDMFEHETECNACGMSRYEIKIEELEQKVAELSMKNDAKFHRELTLEDLAEMCKGKHDFELSYSMDDDMYQIKLYNTDYEYLTSTAWRESLKDCIKEAMEFLKWIINDTDDTVNLSSVIDKIKNLETEVADLTILLQRKTERIVELESRLNHKHSVSCDMMFYDANEECDCYGKENE